MKPEEKVYQIIQQIRPLHKTLHKVVEQELMAWGLSVPKRAILEQIFHKPRQTVPQLARNLDLDRQPVQKQVDELIDLQLLCKVPNPEHKRSWQIDLLPKGRKVYLEIQQNELQAIRQLSKTLSQQDIERCLSLLQRMDQYFRTYPHP